jgi:hypothetical protein
MLAGVADGMAVGDGSDVGVFEAVADGIGGSGVGTLDDAGLQAVSKSTQEKSRKAILFIICSLMLLSLYNLTLRFMLYVLSFSHVLIQFSKPHWHL